LVIALTVLGLAFQARASTYIASVVYAKTPLAAGVNYTPEDGATGLLTVAELNQNSTTGAVTFNWEYMYTPVVGMAVPVNIAIVKYTAGANPSNGQVIYTIANVPGGIPPQSDVSSGVFTLEALNAGRVAAGLPSATVCDPSNLGGPCGDDASTMIHYGAEQLYVITFSDGHVITGFAQVTPDIPYPEPSEDNFYVGTFNGSYGIGNTPALTGDNDVTFAIYNNFDDLQTWSMDVLATFSNTSTAPAVKSVAIVAIIPGGVKTILDLTNKVDLNSPDVNDVGAHTDDAFRYPELTKAMRDAGLTQPTELFGAVGTTTDGSNSFMNYMPYLPPWIQDPEATDRFAPPPPPEDTPTPTPITCVYTGNYKIVPVNAACKGKALTYNKMSCSDNSVTLKPSAAAFAWNIKSLSSGKKKNIVALKSATCANKNLATHNGAKLGGSAWTWKVAPIGGNCYNVNIVSVNGFLGVNSKCTMADDYSISQVFKLVKA